MGSPGAASEEQHWLHAYCWLLVPKGRQRKESSGIELQLDHVEDPVVKQADKRQVVWTLFGVACKQDERGVIFCGEELDS